MKMKFCLVLLTALSLNVFGNDAGIILRGGLNAADAHLSQDVPFGTEKGFRGGVNLALLGDIPLSNSVGILAGGGFENKGFTVSNGQELETFRLNYAVFPLMLSFEKASTSPLSPRNRIFFNAGLEYAVLTSASLELVQNDSTTTVHGHPKRFDFGLCGEFGGEIPLSSQGGSAIFGVGYSYDLTDESANPQTQQAYNYVIKVFVGLKFDLKRNP